MVAVVSSSKANCTHKDDGLVQVFETDEMEIWAGGTSDVKGESWILEPDLAICLRGSSGLKALEPSEVEYSETALEMLPRSQEVGGGAPIDAFICIDWPDRKVPKLAPRFWDELIKDVENLDGKTKVMLYCMGGHGRTGTALTLLGDKLGCIPEDLDAIEYVRAIYCEKAVETKSQIEWLQERFGIDTNAEGSKSYSRSKTYGKSDDDDEDDESSSSRRTGTRGIRRGRGKGNGHDGADTGESSSWDDEEDEVERGLCVICNAPGAPWSEEYLSFLCDPDCVEEGEYVWPPGWDGYQGA